MLLFFTKSMHVTSMDSGLLFIANKIVCVCACVHAYVYCKVTPLAYILNIAYIRPDYVKLTV